MQKKIIIIDKCNRCPHYEIINQGYPDYTPKTKCRLSNKEISKQKISNIDIPVWCELLNFFD